MLIVIVKKDSRFLTGGFPVNKVALKNNEINRAISLAGLYEEKFE